MTSPYLFSTEKVLENKVSHAIPCSSIVFDDDGRHVGSLSVNDWNNRNLAALRYIDISEGLIDSPASFRG